MNSIRVVGVAAIALLCFSTPAMAQKGGHGGGHTGSASSSAATVHVRGYTRKDGTYVDGYDRRGPHSPGDVSLAEIANQTAAGRSAMSTVTATRSSGPAVGSVRFGGTNAHSEYSRDGIYSVTDPTTGRRTYTNRLQASSTPIATQASSATRSSAVTSVRIGHPGPAYGTTAGTRGLTSTRSSTTGGGLRQNPGSILPHRADRCTNCDRDAEGRILRSAEAKDAFKRATGYPKGRSGYVIDHIVPLACGGADAPSNMQWQTVADGKAKDKVERKGCEP